MRNRSNEIRHGSVSDRYLYAVDGVDPSVSPTYKEAHHSFSGTASMSSSSRTPTPVRPSQVRRISMSPPSMRKGVEVSPRKDYDRSRSPRVRLFPATTVPIINSGEETDGSSLTGPRTTETRSTRKPQTSEGSSLDSTARSITPERVHDVSAISNHEALGYKKGWRRRLEGTSMGMKPSPTRGAKADSSWIKKKAPSRHLGGSPKRHVKAQPAQPLTAKMLRERALPNPNASSAPTEVMMNLSSRGNDVDLRSDFAGAPTEVVTNKAADRKAMVSPTCRDEEDAALDDRIRLKRLPAQGDTRCKNPSRSKLVYSTKLSTVEGATTREEPARDIEFPIDEYSGPAQSKLGRLSRHVDSGSSEILPECAASFQSKSISSSVGVETGGRSIDRAPAALKRVLESSPPRSHLFASSDALHHESTRVKMMPHDKQVPVKHKSVGATRLPKQQAIGSKGKEAPERIMSQRHVNESEDAIEPNADTIDVVRTASSENQNVDNPFLLKYPICASSNVPQQQSDAQITSFSDASSGWTPVVFSSSGLDMEDFQAAMRRTSDDDGVQLLFSPDRVNRDVIDFLQFGPPRINRTVTVETDSNSPLQHTNARTVEVGHEDKAIAISRRHTPGNQEKGPPLSSSVPKKTSENGVHENSLARREDLKETESTAVRQGGEPSTRQHSSLVRDRIRSLAKNDTVGTKGEKPNSNSEMSQMQIDGVHAMRSVTEGHTPETEGTNPAAKFSEGERKSRFVGETHDPVGSKTPVTRNSSNRNERGALTHTGNSNGDDLAALGGGVSKMRSRFESSKLDPVVDPDDDDMTSDSMSSVSVKSIRSLFENENGPDAVDDGHEKSSDDKEFTKIRSLFEKGASKREATPNQLTMETVQMFESNAKKMAKRRTDFGYSSSRPRPQRTVDAKENGAASRPTPAAAHQSPGMKETDVGNRTFSGGPKQAGQNAEAIPPKSQSENRVLSIADRIKAMKLENGPTVLMPRRKSAPAASVDKEASSKPHRRYDQPRTDQNSQRDPPSNDDQRPRTDHRRVSDATVRQRQAREQQTISATGKVCPPESALAQGSASFRHSGISPAGSGSAVQGPRIPGHSPPILDSPSKLRIKASIGVRKSDGTTLKTESRRLDQSPYPSPSSPHLQNQALCRWGTTPRNSASGGTSGHGSPFRDKMNKIASKSGGPRFLGGTHRSFSEGYDDGVTLDLSIADVSCLTTPTCLQDPSLEDASSRNSRDINVVEAEIRGPSEASSSQTSEAAAPLLALTMRTKFTNSSDDYGHFSHRSFGERLLPTGPQSRWAPQSPIEEHPELDEQADDLSDPAWDLRNIKNRFAQRQAERADLERERARRQTKSMVVHEPQAGLVTDLEPWQPFESDGFVSTLPSKMRGATQDKASKRPVDAPSTGATRRNVLDRGRDRSPTRHRSPRSPTQSTQLAHAKASVSDANVRSDQLATISTPTKENYLLRNVTTTNLSRPNQKTALVVRTSDEPPDVQKSTPTYPKHVALMSKLNALKEARIRRNAAFSKKGFASSRKHPLRGSKPPTQPKGSTARRFASPAMLRLRNEDEEQSASSSTKFGGNNFEHCLDID